MRLSFLTSFLPSHCCCSPAVKKCSHFFFCSPYSFCAHRLPMSSSSSEVPRLPRGAATNAALFSPSSQPLSGFSSLCLLSPGPPVPESPNSTVDAVVTMEPVRTSALRSVMEAIRAASNVSNHSLLVNGVSLHGLLPPLASSLPPSFLGALPPLASSLPPNGQCKPTRGRQKRGGPRRSTRRSSTGRKPPSTLFS